MANPAYMRFTLAFGAFAATTLLGQQTVAPPGDLPSDRGVYYRAGSNWEPLQRTLWMPMIHGQALDFFSLGDRGARVELPGPQALVRSAGPKPLFYIRGFSPANGMYLVRAQSERQYRDVRMRVDRSLFDGPRFRSRDLYPFDVNGVAPDVVTLTPRTNLQPGEYVIVPAIEAGYRWIQFAYGFGIPAGAGAP